MSKEQYSEKLKGHINGSITNFVAIGDIWRDAVNTGSQDEEVAFWDAIFDLGPGKVSAVAVLLGQYKYFDRFKHKLPVQEILQIGSRTRA